MAVSFAPRAVALAESTLSRGQKAIYGFGDVLIAVRMSCFQFYLLPFYTDVVLREPELVGLAGLAKAIGLLWDGINDPVAGYLSDRTRTRLGRRRPFMLGAALPLGVAFALVWWAPTTIGTTWRFVYLVVAFLVMDTAFSLYATPYLALGAELSRNYHERTQLAAARGAFHLLGLILGVAVPGIIIGWHGHDSPTGYRVMGITLGAGMVLVACVTALGLRERRPSAAPPEDVSWHAFVGGLRSTLRNPSFRILVLSFGFILLGAGLYQTLLPYAFRYWLRHPELIGSVPLVYIIASVVSLPIWTRLAGRLGKDRAMRACIAWAAVALGATPFVLGPGVERPTMFFFVGLAGLGNGGWVVIPASLMADAVDWDELHTRARREGAYFGIWTLVMKVAAAVASGAVGVALQAIGYVPNAEQTASTILGIKILYGPVPALFMLAALVVFQRFPLTRARHEEVQAALAARSPG
jgi:GPH family glycoside/pentoside/hexuronide:cation symporter